MAHLSSTSFLSRMSALLSPSTSPPFALTSVCSSALPRNAKNRLCFLKAAPGLPLASYVGKLKLDIGIHHHFTLSGENGARLAASVASAAARCWARRSPFSASSMAWRAMMSGISWKSSLASSTASR